MRRYLLIAVFLLSGLAQHAEAATRYAAPGGGAAAGCTNSGADVCSVARAVTVATNGETIELSAGTYPGTELGASGYVIVSNENLSFDCVTNGACIFQPSGAGSGIRYNIPIAGTPITIDGVVVERQSGVATDQCFWFSDATGIYDVTVSDTVCRDTDFYDIRVVANEINLTATNNTFTSSAAYSPRSYLFTNNTWDAGSIVIQGGTTTILSYNDTATPIINIVSASTAPSVLINNFSATWTPDPAISTGHLDGIAVKNVNNAVISNNTLTVNAGVGTVDSRMILCYSSTAGLTSDNCVIRGNTLTNKTVSGQMASIGTDANSVGNNLSLNGLIEDNRIYCTQDATDIHGAGIFWNNGGVVRRNYVENCGIGVIGKDQNVGGLFYANIINDQWQQGLYSKGSNGVRFINNSVFTGNGVGLPVVIGADSSTSSTNAVLVNNLLFGNSNATQTLLTTASSQTIAQAAANDWYGFGTTSWTYLGTVYGSLSEWNTVSPSGTDLAVNPVFNNYPNDLRLYSTSPLRQAGIRVGDYTDYRGRYFNYKPSIGAFEVGSGDFSTVRQWAI